MRFAIRVSSLADLPRALRDWRPTHLLSLHDVGAVRVPRGVERTVILCDDVEDPGKPRAPTRAQVTEVLALGRGLPDGARLLIQCEAGVSRSGAAGLALMVQEIGVESAVEKLATVRPQAHPNALMTRYADELLGLGGELMTVLPAIWERADDLLAESLAGDA